MKLEIFFSFIVVNDWNPLYLQRNSGLKAEKTE
jgi:hypothetical protein